MNKELRKIGYLFGYVPALVLFWFAIKVIDLIQWIRYDVREMMK